MASLVEILSVKYPGQWARCGDTYASIVWDATNPPAPIPTEAQLLALGPEVDALLAADRAKAEEQRKLARVLGPDATLYVLEELIAINRGMLRVLHQQLRQKLAPGAFTSAPDWSALDAAITRGQALLDRIAQVRDRIAGS